MFFSTIKWMCDCLCNPPSPREDVTNNCEIGASGINPMNGLICTEPTLIEETVSLAVDPPECYGGDSTLCSPMPTIFRVVFPCPVPGSSNCPPEEETP